MAINHVVGQNITVYSGFCNEECDYKYKQQHVIMLYMNNIIASLMHTYCLAGQLLIYKYSYRHCCMYIKWYLEHTYM